MVEMAQRTKAGKKPERGTVWKIRGCKSSDGYYMVSHVWDTYSWVRYPDGSLGWEKNDTILSDEHTDLTMMDFLRLEMQTMWMEEENTRACR